MPISQPNNVTSWYSLASHVGGGASARVTSTGAVMLHLRRRHGQAASRPGSRAYLADTCVEGEPADSSSYAALSLLGKTLSFTVDVSKASCGCVVAAYLVPMRANRERGSCGDFYCDANRVCGVGCSEIDIMEANSRAFLSTTHTLEPDCYGRGSGVGGANHAFSASAYGPRGSTIDTDKPFRVHAYFEAAAADPGMLQDMAVTLGQSGRSLRFSPAPRHCLERHSAAMSRATLVLSYWSAPSANLSWFDQPPCAVDDQDACGESVRISRIDLRPGRLKEGLM